MHVRVDDTGEGEEALAVVSPSRLAHGGELAVGNTDIALDHFTHIGADDTDVLDDEVVGHFFRRFSRWGRRPPSRTICMRWGGIGSQSSTSPLVWFVILPFSKSMLRLSPGRIRFASRHTTAGSPRFSALR